MRIVTTNFSLHNRFPIEKNIELIANAGFDGIGFTQTHAPVMSSVLRQYDGNLQFAADRICRSLEFAHLLGAEHVVVHPIQHPKYATEAERLFKENMNFFSKLVPDALKFMHRVAESLTSKIENARRICDDK